MNFILIVKHISHISLMIIINRQMFLPLQQKNLYILVQLASFHLFGLSIHAQFSKPILSILHQYYWTWPLTQSSAISSPVQALWGFSTYLYAKQLYVQH